MNVTDYLSNDGQVLVALCSNLAASAEPAPDAPQPFKLSEWNELSRAIEQSEFKAPSMLHGQSADALARKLALPGQDAERIARLLDRSGRLAIEIENLFARGIWIVTRADELYPARLKKTLKRHAPALLFGAGEVRLANQGGLAVIGSRNIDEPGSAFARAIGARAQASGLQVVSGGARGTDRLAMEGALQAGGAAIGVLADSLERTVRQPDIRQLLLDDQLVLVTPYSPAAGFSIGGAMGRNKIIYGLSDFAVVVSSDFQTGGTWAGAVEAIKAGWCPVFARESAQAPKGNSELIKLGAAALPESEIEKAGDLAAWLRAHAKAKPVERDLFG
jgi:predicted Rossmann fold nucleotide-binding protein DprA/Smf involved in DNA uptake